MSILNNIPHPQYLLLRTCKGIETIDVKNIIRIEAISNYSKLYFSNGKTLVVARVLRLLEAQLSQQQFFRVHRTHIVNRWFIDQYLGGKMARIKLINGECIDISKRKKAGFLRSWINVSTDAVFIR